MKDLGVVKKRERYLWTEILKKRKLSQKGWGRTYRVYDGSRACG